MLDLTASHGTGIVAYLSVQENLCLSTTSNGKTWMLQDLMTNKKNAVDCGNSVDLCAEWVQST